MLYFSILFEKYQNCGWVFIIKRVKKRHMFRDITLRLWKSHVCSIGLRSCDFTANTTSRLLPLPITSRPLSHGGVWHCHLSIRMVTNGAGIMLYIRYKYLIPLTDGQKSTSIPYWMRVCRTVVNDTFSNHGWPTTKSAMFSNAAVLEFLLFLQKRYDHH